MNNLKCHFFPASIHHLTVNLLLNHPLHILSPPLLLMFTCLSMLAELHHSQYFYLSSRLTIPSLHREEVYSTICLLIRVLRLFPPSWSFGTAPTFTSQQHNKVMVTHVCTPCRNDSFFCFFVFSYRCQQFLCAELQELHKSIF